MFAKAVVDKNPVADDTYLISRRRDPGRRAGRSRARTACAGSSSRAPRTARAAEQLIRYMLSPDVQKEIFKICTGYVYPAYEWGWDDAINRRQPVRPARDAGLEDRRVRSERLHAGRVAGPADAVDGLAGVLELLDRHVRRGARRQASRRGRRKCARSRRARLQGVRRQGRVTATSCTTLGVGHGGRADRRPQPPNASGAQFTGGDVDGYFDDTAERLRQVQRADGVRHLVQVLAARARPRLDHRLALRPADGAPALRPDRLPVRPGRLAQLPQRRRHPDRRLRRLRQLRQPLGGRLLPARRLGDDRLHRWSVSHSSSRSGSGRRCCSTTSRAGARCSAGWCCCRTSSQTWCGRSPGACCWTRCSAR